MLHDKQSRQHITESPARVAGSRPAGSTVVKASCIWRTAEASRIPQRQCGQGGASPRHQRPVVPPQRCHAVPEATFDAPLLRMLGRSLTAPNSLVVDGQVTGEMLDQYTLSPKCETCRVAGPRPVRGLDIAPDWCLSRNRAEPATDDDTQGTAAARVFLRRRPRVNHQCLISQLEDGDEGAETDACTAPPAGPDEAHAGRDDAPRRASGQTRAAVWQPAARLHGVPALGCSKCRMAKRGCGKCRHDRWTALKVSMSMLSAAAVGRPLLVAFMFVASRKALANGTSSMRTLRHRFLIRSATRLLGFRLLDWMSWSCNAKWSPA